jgi:hypothetical protein
MVMSIRSHGRMCREGCVPLLRRSVMCMSLTCMGLWLAFAPGTSRAQTKQDPDYQAGLVAWRSGNYALASQHLSRYSLNVSYGKSYDVDYLLGTAWCRMPGMAGKGAALLDWAMQQDMPVATAQQFKLELTRCRQRIAQEATSAGAASSAAPPHAAPRPEWLVRTSVGAGASIRASGKMFYVVGGGDKGSFASYPLELVRPMPESVYEARLFPLDQTQAATQAAKLRLGKGYNVLAVGRFIMGSPSHNEADLRRIADRLESFAGFLENNYGIRFAPRYINVNIAPTTQHLASTAMALHGLRASSMTLGYTFQNDLSVNAVMTSTGAGTLLHELFHLGVRANFGDIPSWLDESIASLYETSVEAGGQYFGAPNWRGDVVRQMAWGHRFRLEDLVGHLSDDRVRTERARHGDQAEAAAQNDEAAYDAALGRYFALYLQETGKLNDLYQAFRDRPDWVETMPAQKASLGLIEMSVGKPLAMLESDFLAWLPKATQNRNWQPRKSAGGTPVLKEIPPSLLSPPPAASAAGSFPGP